MGIFNTYGSVQIKADVDDFGGPEHFSVGDATDLPDGAYIGYEGVVVIQEGKFHSEHKKLFDKWGNEIDKLTFLQNNSVIAAIRDVVKKHDNEN